MPTSNFGKWKAQIRWWIIRRRAWFGYHYYGYFGPRTVRIGPNTVLKWGVDVDIAEVDAMRFVAEHTTVPVPKVYEVWKHGKVTVILMQYVRGRPAWGAWNRLTAIQFSDVCNQLEGYVKQLRALSPPSSSQVSSTCGGPCRDHRFGRLAVGPFDNLDEFHRFLRNDADLRDYERSHPDVVAVHSGSYASRFTHGDLSPRNVILRNGKIAAIIDWDSSGWRPEYWEYTKAYFTPLGVPQEWFDALKRATGNCDQHLKSERCLWIANEFPGDPAVYPHQDS